MIFYCVEARTQTGDVQNAWTARKDEALRMARTLRAPIAKSIRVLRVIVIGKNEMAELLNVASGIIPMHVNAEVIWRYAQSQLGTERQSEPTPSS